MTAKEEQKSNVMPVPSTEDGVNAIDQSSDSITIPSLELTQIENEGLHTAHFNGTLDSIIESNTRRYGVTTLLRLLSSFLKDVNDRATKTMEDAEREHKKNEDLVSNNIELKVELATLKATAEERKKNSNLLKFAMFTGVILFTLGLDQIHSSNYSLGWILLILGGILVLLVFFNDKNGI